MKFTSFPSCVVALWVVLSSAPASSAQESEKQSGSKILNPVVSLAERTLDAVRNKDTGFLSSLVDPAGISIGLDTRELSATRFRKELDEKRGVYCVIFDGCPSKNGDLSRRESSLRGVWMAQSVSMNLQGVEGRPQEKAVAVKGSKDSNNVLFTLVFRHVGNHWVLQQIEFF